VHVGQNEQSGKYPAVGSGVSEYSSDRCQSRILLHSRTVSDELFTHRELAD